MRPLRNLGRTPPAGHRHRATLWPRRPLRGRHRTTPL
jgi:hypothetical protein